MSMAVSVRLGVYVEVDLERVDIEFLDFLLYGDYDNEHGLYELFSDAHGELMGSPNDPYLLIPNHSGDGCESWVIEQSSYMAKALPISDLDFSKEKDKAESFYLEKWKKHFPGDALKWHYGLTIKVS